MSFVAKQVKWQKEAAVRIWKIEELCVYPGMALAVATVKTPASWRTLKSKAWLCHAGEAMRALFPNLPEAIEGPWGALPRDEVFGADEACSAILDVMEGLCLVEGEAIGSAFCECGFESGVLSLDDLVEEGKIELIDAQVGQLSITSQSVRLTIVPPRSAMSGDRALALKKVDQLLEKIGSEMQRWMPAMIELGDPAKLTKDEIERAVALSRRAEIDRAASLGHRSKGPKSRL